MPLVCAMYCLVAGRGPLPETRTALYGQVAEELLEGAWRQHSTPAGLQKAKELIEASMGCGTS